MMLPDTSQASTEALAHNGTDDAVAFISLDGSVAAAPKAVQDNHNADFQQQELHHEESGPAAEPTCLLRAASSAATDQTISSQASTPTGGWRSKLLLPCRQQQEQQQQQQQAAAVPPGCLVLDGEVLQWQELQQDSLQEQWQQQQQQQLLQHWNQSSSLSPGLWPCNGFSSQAGSSTSPAWGQQQQQQHGGGRMRSSLSSPNLVLLPDGSHQQQSPGYQQQQDPQQQQQQQVQEQDPAGVLGPMHSSMSCDSLLNLCRAGSGGLPQHGQWAAAQPPAAPTFPKSRLGQATSEADAFLPSQQQQQQQDGRQEVASPLLAVQSAGATWSPLQQQQQEQGQQQQQQAPLLQDLIAQQLLRQQTPPGLIAAGSTSGSTCGSVSGSGHITSWTFERCNSTSVSFSETLARRLRVHCVTFNMNGKLPASLPPELLGECGVLRGAPTCDGSSSSMPDVLAFATQENSCISEWEKLLSAALGPSGYSKLAWHSLRAIHLVLFASRRFTRQVLSIRASAVATGIGNVVGNKGAVALSVELLDLKLLFISSHLAAHGDQVAQRNADYQRIKAGLFAAKPTPTTPRSATLRDPGSSTSSPRARRTSLQLPRPSSVVDVHRVSCSECGTRRPGGPAVAAGAGDRSGSAASSVPSSSGPSWLAAVWHSHNQVVPLDLAAGPRAPEGWQQQQQQGPNASSTGEGAIASTSAEGGQKRVTWWAELSAGDTSPSCSSPALSVTPSGPSEGLMLGQQHTSGTAAQQTAAGCLQLNRLRVASCPSLKQPLGPGGGAAEDSSGWELSGATTPVCGSSLSASAAAGSTGVADEVPGAFSFLRQAARKHSGTVSQGSRPTVDALESHDVVFWLGDLNYRINGNSKAVRHLMRSRLHEVLHANDQLRLQQKVGAVFQGFKEGRISFPPTFKFLPGSSAYSDKRVPSWTDRILWTVRSKPRQQQQEQLQPQLQQQQEDPYWGGADGETDEPPPEVTQLYYTSVPTVTSSDHKPVIAGFEVAALGQQEAEEEAARRSRELQEEAEGALRTRCCRLM